MDVFFKSEGFDTIGFEQSVWKRADGGKYAEDNYVSAHVDDCLIACKSKDMDFPMFYFARSSNAYRTKVVSVSRMTVRYTVSRSSRLLQIFLCKVYKSRSTVKFISRVTQVLIFSEETGHRW